MNPTLYDRVPLGKKRVHQLLESDLERSLKHMGIHQDRLHHANPLPAAHQNTIAKCELMKTANGSPKMHSGTETLQKPQ